MSTNYYLDQHWLSNAYKSKSINEIARECGVSSSTIRNYIHKYGIKTRSVSESAKLKYADDSYYSLRLSQWRSEEYKDKQKSIAESNKSLKSEISKKLWQSEEYIDNHSASHSKAMKSAETRKKISEGIKNKYKDTQFVIKQQSLRDKRSKLLSATMIRLWKNAEYRNKKLDQNKLQGERRRLTTNEFIKRARLSHGDMYNYENTKYIDYDRCKITVGCTICGNEYEQTPSNHLKGSLCPYCRASAGHREMVEYVSDKCEYFINDRSIVAPLELDIFVPDKNLAIEYNGLRWHSYGRIESKQEKYRHQYKSNKCSSVGIKLLQIWDFQWDNKRDIVKSMVLHRLGLSNKINARDTFITCFDNKVAGEFFDQNHLYGKRDAAFNIGLVCGNTIMAVMSLTGKNGGYEIIRMANKCGHVVVGGFSKLVKYVTKELRAKTIMSYADLMYSDGHGYIAAGFKLESVTVPGYFYYKGNTILSRQQCQKHKLQILLGNGYNANLSESENMFINGFRRVWDAGNLRLVYRG